MATTYTDPSDWLAWALQGRTDASAQAADDATGEDARAILDFWTEGVLNGYSVSEKGAGADMSVDVAVGAAVLEGTETDQGNYFVKIAGSTAVNVTIGAADVSNPRIDEVYLVVQDSGYDESSNVIPRIAVRDGTPASSPSAPGPDTDWTAFLLLATVAVAANEDAIEDEHITDKRVNAGPTPSLMSAWEVDESVEVATVALTTSLAEAASVTLAIPSDWGSWKCNAFASGSIDAGGGFTETSYRVVIAGTAQQTVVTNVPTDAGADNPGMAFSVGGRRTGITATGSQTVVLQMSREANGFEATDLYLYARAVRTS